MNKKAIIAIMFFITAITANAQFLFRISGNGLKNPSYMLGTIHTTHGSVLDYAPEYAEAEAQCQQFYTEYDITDRQRIREINNAIEQMKAELKLPDGKTIQDFLSKEQMELVDAKVKEAFGQNLSDPKMAALWHQQPLVLTHLISNKIRSEAMKKHGPKLNSRSALIDATCIIRAKLHGMKLGQLDELEDQLKAQGFRPQSIDEQLDSLMALVRNYDQRKESAIKEIEIFKQSVVYWCLADFKSFSAMDYWKKTIKSSPFVFKERNEKWLPKMQTAMKEAPTMFDFGAGHLLGDDGIIQRLRNAGYKVEQIKLK